jgi:hypothetical protein
MAAIVLCHAVLGYGAQVETPSQRDTLVRTCRIDLRRDRLQMFWKDSNDLFTTRVNVSPHVTTSWAGGRIGRKTSTI